MEDEGLVILYEVHSEQAVSETETLLLPTPPTFVKFRVGRETQQSRRCIGLMLAAFKVCFCSLGLWGHQAWNNIPRVLLGIICFYHIFFMPYCGALPCSKSSYHNLTESEKRRCHSLKIEYIAVVTLAMASILSCLVFIGCCVARKCKKLVLLAQPSQSRDINECDIFILFLAFLTTNVLLTVSVILFYQIDTSTLSLPDYLFCNILIPTGNVTFFFLQWVSVNICHIFAACCFALGKL